MTQQPDGEAMPDIRLVQLAEFPYQQEESVDWLLLRNGTLDDTEALATAVIVALGTDRLAQEDDVPYLPDPDSTDRRGWWGDMDAGPIWQGWPIGSRLWTLRREKITGAGAQRGSTVVRVKWYIQEALQPFLDLKICSRFDVEVMRISEQRIDALIQMYRGPQLAIDLRYQVLWDDILPQSPIGPYYTGRGPFT
jgi:phage gp46-like protein